MAYTTINKGSLYMNPVLYTGNGSDGHAITGVGFQSDMTWIKQRSGTENHCIFDVVRGSTERLSPDTTGASWDSSTNVQSFDSDGFTLGTSNQLNASSATQVAWNWKAGGTASSNTDGTITSSVSANTTSGFSVVSWTGTGATATVGHGLGTTPKLFIVKETSEARNWPVVTTAIDGSWDSLYLNLTDTAGSSPQSADSSVFNFTSSNEFNASGQTYVSYCFANKAGFSRMGSYVGNGSADGTFVYTGFKPAFVMLKSSSNVTEWIMHDNDRLGYNGGNQPLFPNNSGAEDANSRIDLLSNGFKLKDSSVHWNGSGYSFIYLAIAESPIVGTNGVPATAR